MTEHIEIVFEDGSRAVWVVDSPNLLDEVTETITEILGEPDSVGP